MQVLVALVRFKVHAKLDSFVYEAGERYLIPAESTKALVENGTVEFISVPEQSLDGEDVHFDVISDARDELSRARVLPPT